MIAAGEPGSTQARIVAALATSFAAGRSQIDAAPRAE
jgi:hypothetical protein